MAAISTANLARLTSASPEQMRAAVEAVLTLAGKLEEDAQADGSRYGGLIGTRFRLLVEGVISA